MTAGPPTEPILTAEFSDIHTALGIALDLSNDPEYVELAIKSLSTIRARLRDAEETLRAVRILATRIHYNHPITFQQVWLHEIERRVLVYFERRADPQEKP